MVQPFQYLWLITAVDYLTFRWASERSNCRRSEGIHQTEQLFTRALCCPKGRKFKQHSI